jgi:hypothetical protein
MNRGLSTVEQLQAFRHRIHDKAVLAGFDGFVDKIVVPVALRHGPGENFEPIETMTEFARRIQGAAGKSTNIELHQRMEKLGGNGPLMGGALLAYGARLKYLGALGANGPVAALADFAARSDAITLAEPGFTTAVEFSDGKLMLNMISDFGQIDYARLTYRVGGEPALRELAAHADLIALVNWTMLPHMTEIFRAFVGKILPLLPSNPERLFFFDLADPEKRTDVELLEALQVIARFEAFGHVTLGLNLKEAERVGRVLGVASGGEDEPGLRKHAASIREKLSLSIVVVHPRKSAACATTAGTFWVPGPYCAAPLVTTGAGDHFNAGFALGQLLGMTPNACLATGVATSGLYVRSGKSPTLDELEKSLSG